MRKTISYDEVKNKCNKTVPLLWLLLLGDLAPMPVVDPGVLLAIFTTILGSTAAPTFRKLPCKLLPFAALVVGTLPYTTSIVVLATEVSHYYASPMLHVLRMMPHCKLFHQGEDIEVVG